MNQADVIIIGGGVAGLLSARELTLACARVTLLERQTLGKESSWAGGGILSPLCPWRTPVPITALCRWSQTAYPHLAESLRERTGLDPEWLQSGLLFGDCGELPEATAWAQAQGVPHEQLATTEAALLEPQIRPLAGPSLLLPGIGQVRNPRMLSALRADLTALGVDMREHHPVDAIKLERGKVVGVVCQQETLTAGAYVLTAGAWTGLLARDNALPGLPITPVKGEMLVFDAPPGLLNRIVLNQGRYLIPRKDGKILVGSTVEHAQFNKCATDAARQALSDFAWELLPALRQYRIEKHWAGLRPGSPDGIPTIGPHPGIGNLYLNSGHFRNGFVMAPASARLLADHVLSRPAVVPPEPYLPRTGN